MEMPLSWRLTHGSHPILSQLLAMLHVDIIFASKDKANILWNGANPSIIAPELQRVLGTRSCSSLATPWQ